MFRPKVIVSKRELFGTPVRLHVEHHSNVVEAHISNLRRKLRSVTETKCWRRCGAVGIVWRVLVP